jgi:hypothetical protein
VSIFIDKTPNTELHLGTIEEVHSPKPTFGSPQPPVFGSTHNQNVPFIFQSPPPPETSNSYPWVPPPAFSFTKAFQPEEQKDIDMSESGPIRPDAENSERENGRPMALGALRRVYYQRHGSRFSKASRLRQMSGDEDKRTDSDSDDEDDFGPITQNTSNHYTLNMQAPVPAPSEKPYVLLGWVSHSDEVDLHNDLFFRYLQFFFNLSLLLLFLYLVVQFIITIQRDVQHRVSEYSQGGCREARTWIDSSPFMVEIVQEIAMCALQFRNNLCETSPVPAMVQQCARWETCMNRDPTVVGRAKVSAELIAEVVNGFVEPISWKTLVSVASPWRWMLEMFTPLIRSSH